MISHEQEIRPETLPARFTIGLSQYRRLLFQVLAAGLILIPNLVGLLFFGPVKVLSQVGEFSLKDWLSILLPQTPGLVIGLLLFYCCLGCKSLPAWVPMTLFVPVLLAHFWSTISIMFAGPH